MGVLLVAPAAAYAQSITLQAVTDFPVIDSGEVPYYQDLAGNRNVLAINAAVEAYRERFARADHIFQGADGIYHVTIEALGELDGDCEYRLLVNGIVQGSAVNTPVTTDYQVIEHTFPGIAISNRDTISVESNAVSNNQIPENDAFAFARGRWRSLALSPQDNTATEPGSIVDLSIRSNHLAGDALRQGDSVTVFATVFNLSDTVATNTVVDVVIPDSLSFDSSEHCTRNTTGASCTIGEVAARGNSSVSFNTRVDAAGWSSLGLSAVADQSDSDISNNSTNSAFNALPAVAANATDSKSGALSWAVLLLGTVIGLRMRGRVVVRA